VDESLAVHGRRGRGFITSGRRLPSLDPLLRNETVAKAITAYLGGSARFDG
jgi:hypothetical protein